MSYMNYSFGVMKHFESKIRTNSKYELTGLKDPKVFIAICKFAGSQYLFVKNYTSCPILIGDFWVNGKQLCCLIGSAMGDQIKKSTIKIIQKLELKQNQYGLSVVTCPVYNYVAVDDNQLATQYDFVIPTDNSLFQQSPLDSYLYKFDISEYKKHFSCIEGVDKVSIGYSTNGNTLIGATISGDDLLFSDAKMFELYLNKLIHTIKYNNDSSYKNAHDNTAFTIKGMLPLMSGDKLQKLLDVMKEMV